MSAKQCLKVAGYTLIEVLIVLFIISIVTGIVLLSIGHNENKQVKAFAEELTQTLTLAQEQAMLQPTVLGLTINNDFFQFSSYKQTSATQKSSWQPLQDKLLGRHAVPEGVQLDVRISGNSIHNATTVDDEDDVKENMPQIVISTNGDVTPFTIYVGKTGKKPQYVIKGDSDGKITKRSLDQ